MIEDFNIFIFKLTYRPYFSDISTRETLIKLKWPEFTVIMECKPARVYIVMHAYFLKDFPAVSIKVG